MKPPCLNSWCSWFTTTNIVMLLLVLNFITLSLVLGFLLQFGQISERYNADVNATAQALIHKSDRNYLTVVDAIGQLSNNTNSTNTLLKFLTDNFGANSGYLEKETFQYKQANDTFRAIVEDENNTIGNITQHRDVTNHSFNLIFKALGINQSLDE